VLATPDYNLSSTGFIKLLFFNKRGREVCIWGGSDQRVTVLAGGWLDKAAVKLRLIQFSPFHIGC